MCGITHIFIYKVLQSYIYLFIEPPKKLNKIDNTLQKEPLKQKKLDENSHTLVTPPQSPSTQNNVNPIFSNILLIYVYRNDKE